MIINGDDMKLRQFLLCLISLFLMFALMLSLADAHNIFFCGKERPLQFNKDTHECYDNQIRLRPKPVTSPGRRSTAVPPRDAPLEEITEACRNMQPGMECCRRHGPYSKDFSTCCTSGYKACIYEGLPQRKHVCCGLDAYKRDDPSKIPCSSAALNDRLSPGIGYRHAKRRICSKSRAYVMRFGASRLTSENQAIIEASLKFLPKWRYSRRGKRGGDSNSRMSKSFDVVLDDGNRDKEYHRVMIFSDHDYYTIVTGLFYLRWDDIVVKAKKGKISKRLRKMRKFCKIVWP